MLSCSQSVGKTREPYAGLKRFAGGPESSPAGALAPDASGPELTRKATGSSSSSTATGVSNKKKRFVQPLRHWLDLLVPLAYLQGHPRRILDGRLR